jgi:hypothetical protein
VTEVKCERQDAKDAKEDAKGKKVIRCLMKEKSHPTYNRIESWMSWRG